ncbi:MAG: outer membrane beta-barrel protein [Bacteroidota bacterium]|nr:outer membrane beta-barrel protein [Bacteroidota bacterium]
MKRIFTLCVALCTIITGFAQTDTTGTKTTDPKNDTIRIGGMIIIRKAGSKEREVKKDDDYKTKNGRDKKPSNLTTNWWIFDLGFSSFSDKTNYSSLAAQAYAPGSNKTWFDLKDGKSRNVNFWLFMQKLNIVKHVVNLKYGLGLELNNYHFEQPVRFQENTIAIPDPPRVILDATANRKYEKNKLAADYLTVPIMLNFNFTPNRKKGFGISAGVSAGYLYSSRNKTETSDEGKEKTKDDFELEKWKVSYVAELALGPVRFYGSYAVKSMFERGLDMTPYNFGFRFSNW